MGCLRPNNALHSLGAWTLVVLGHLHVFPVVPTIGTIGRESLISDAGFPSHIQH